MKPDRTIFLIRIGRRCPAIGFIVSAICFVLLILAVNRDGVAEDRIAQGRPVDFQREIRPLLSDRCMGCHGTDRQHREADLQMNSLEDLLRDRGGYQVLVPGSPEKSRLIERIRSTDPELQMPPHHSGKALSPSEMDVLQRWIREGAVWSEHWAWVPPISHAPPKVQDAAWTRNWIDSWILAELDSRGLTPSPDAAPLTQIRRLYFDLTGLPPEFKTAQELANRWDQTTRDQLVDDLLKSDAHAERMTSWWLDLVRYADTVGYHGDQEHHISPYRDWVIDAFANNMSFDQFTREQIAGDLLPDATIDQKIVSGYNRLIQTTHEGGLQPKEYLTIYAADRVRNVSSVWLGSTLGCAQCHDHKFDPYTTQDFYSMSAFFADIDEEKHFTLGSNESPTPRPPEIKVLSRRERRQLELLTTELGAIESQLAGDPQNETLLDKKKQTEFAIDDLKATSRWTMVSQALPSPRTIRILPRGNWMDDSGAVVLPAVPAFLGTLEPLHAGQQQANRLDLANWLTDSRSGIGLLTARVVVNRLWALYFGAGLSTSLEDFGGQGQPPHHPELLDRLAIELVESGWNLRHVIRLIVLSRTYQQSSEQTERMRAEDPANSWQNRQASFRLPAEMIRDNALAVSGLLVRKVGGPSVRPYQPDDYYRHLNFPTRRYVHHDDDRQWRRGVYIHWQRQFLHPMLKAFDAPMREDCTAQRPQNNTPLAALVLLNDPTFVEAARSLADRTLVENPNSSDDEKLTWLFCQALTRVPDESEMQLLRELLGKDRTEYRLRIPEAEKLVRTGLAPVRFEDHAELAAWVNVARVVMNLDEFVTRL